MKAKHPSLQDVGPTKADIVNALVPLKLAAAKNDELRKQAEWADKVLKATESGVAGSVHSQACVLRVGDVKILVTAGLLLCTTPKGRNCLLYTSPSPRD
eukprot:6429861-Alexandrium_andersonii.AAC.1